MASTTPAPNAPKAEENVATNVAPDTNPGNVDLPAPPSRADAVRKFLEEKLSPQAQPAAKPEAKPEAKTEPKEEPTKSESKPPEPSADEKFYQALASQRELRKAQETLKAKEAELTEFNRLKDLKNRVAEGDLDALAEMGGSLETLSNSVFEGDAEKETKKIRKELEELKRQYKETQENLQKQQQEEQQKQVASRVEQFRQGVVKQIDELEEFKVLTAAGLQNEVFNVIKTHAEKTEKEHGTPQLLDTIEAARYVKNYYRPQLEKLLTQLKGLDDFKSYFGAPASAPTAIQKPTAEPRSLLASEATGGTALDGGTQAPNSMDERKQRAMELLMAKMR